MNIKKYTRNRLLMIGFSIVVLFVLLLFLLFTIAFPKRYVVNYSELGNLNYKVYLKANDYYQTPYLSDNKTYISTLIDNIDLNFNYNFKSESNFDLSYNYKIVGTLSIMDTRGIEIFSKSYPLTSNVSKKSVDGMSFGINEHQTINYDYYNVIAKNFMNTYSISGTSNFKVELLVNIDGATDEYENGLSNNAVMSATIPLNENMTNIELSYEAANDDHATLEYSGLRIRSKFLFALVIILIVLDILSIIYFSYLYLDSRSPRAKYNAKLNKYKKNYAKYLSEAVVTETNRDILNNPAFKVIQIKTFENLLVTRDTLKKPIVYQEEKSITTFYMYGDGIVYVYTMKVNDFYNGDVKDKDIIDIIQEIINKITSKFKKKEEPSYDDIENELNKKE